MAPADWSVEEKASLRRLMREVLPTEVEFEAFCIDCFRDVLCQHFSSGMERLKKENLLLQHAAAQDVRQRLEQWSMTLQTESERPREHCRSAIQRLLSRQLQELYDRKEQTLLSGQDLTELDALIRAVRRDQRHGPSLHHGEVLGDRFVLDRIIGKGGFACVWRAYDRVSRSMVAVKVLHGQWSGDDSRIERFQRGATRMAELHHPGVVRVIVPAQQDSGFYFYATEYLAGGDLRRALLGRQMTEQQALDALLQVGEALQYAHERQFIHRDIKPSNIMLDDKLNAKIGDFDLVHVPDSSGGTRTTAIGSVFYAAPEAMENAKAVDQPTSDVYSLGMTLAFVVYGSDLPQNAWTDRRSFWRELQCSQRLSEVIERATELDPKERYPSATAFCDSLRTARQLDMEKPQPFGIGPRRSPRLPRRFLGGGAAAVVLFAVAFLGWRGLEGGPSERRAGTSEAGRTHDAPILSPPVTPIAPVETAVVPEALPSAQPLTDKPHDMERSKSPRRNKDNDDGLQLMELRH